MSNEERKEFLTDIRNKANRLWLDLGFLKPGNDPFDVLMQDIDFNLSSIVSDIDRHIKRHIDQNEEGGGK